MYGYIYKITNLINLKWYIGMHQYSKNSIDLNYWGSGLLIKQAIIKYGKDNFSQEILAIAETKDELIQKEIFYINITNAVNDPMSYNIASGGNGGNLGLVVNQKISNSLKGRKRNHLGKYYTNGKDNIYLYNIDIIPIGFYEGKTYISQDIMVQHWKETMAKKTIEEKQAIIDKQVAARKITWNNKTEEEKQLVGQHISEAKKGKKLSEEHKQHLRKPKSEEHKQHLRKPKSEEHKQHLSESRIIKGVAKGSNNPRAKQVRCIETGIIYSYSGEAELATGISNRQIRACCNKVHKTAGGLHWEYIND